MEDGPERLGRLGFFGSRRSLLRFRLRGRFWFLFSEEDHFALVYRMYCPSVKGLFLNEIIYMSMFSTYAERYVEKSGSPKHVVL